MTRPARACLFRDRCRALARPRNTAAFSLIEVLVATTLLILIVVTVGMVFRQSMLAWDSGIQRADGSMLVRSVIGALERDLRSAVDGRGFTNGAWASGRAMEVSAASATFIALLPAEGDGPREPNLVTLTGGTTVTRKTQPLNWTGSKWAASGGSTVTLLSAVAEDPFKASIMFDKEDAADANDLPLWVTVEVELVNTENFSGASVRSRGRDGKPGTVDDILIR